jgi:hypothetical protein
MFFQEHDTFQVLSILNCSSYLFAYILPSLGVGWGRVGNRMLAQCFLPLPESCPVWRVEVQAQGVVLLGLTPVRKQAM